MAAAFNVSAASVSIVLLVVIGQAVAEEKLKAKGKAQDVDVQRLTLDELVARLATAPYGRSAKSEASIPTYESILCEIVRRGGRDSEIALRQVLSELQKKLKGERDRLDHLSKSEKEFADDIRLNHMHQPLLNVITSLRRVESKPDPLEITVIDPQKLTTGTRDLPLVVVRVKNVDTEKLSLPFQPGGFTRSRWRVRVWDSQGNLLPELGPPDMLRRGISQRTLDLFEYGEIWRGVLLMNQYVSIPQAGEYTVQVLYQNEQTIADVEDPSSIDGLILIKSKPFTLKVEDGPNVSIRVPVDDSSRTLR